MDLTGINFTEDGSQVFGTMKTTSIIFSASGTWGSGTLAVELFNTPLGEYLPIAKYTEDSYKELSLGKGASVRVTLTGSTDPDLNVGVFEVR